MLPVLSRMKRVHAVEPIYSKFGNQENKPRENSEQAFSLERGTAGPAARMETFCVSRVSCYVVCTFNTQRTTYTLCVSSQVKQPSI